MTRKYIHADYLRYYNTFAPSGASAEDLPRDFPGEEFTKSSKIPPRAYGLQIR